MHRLLIACLLPMLAVEVPPTTAAVPHKHVVAVRGLLLCGKQPADNVRVRLFRTKQNKKDGMMPSVWISYTGDTVLSDLNQILDEKITTKPGTFLLEGNTNGFPLNETHMEPVVSFYHTCDDDAKNVNKVCYTLKIPCHVFTRIVG
uniref:Transthyretin-like family protein n=1 Tax=Angiostrongylus cantonensis TaxID=6313 RepID=A0A0K0CV68_ANGCA